MLISTLFERINIWSIRMLIKTILNYCHKIKGFNYQKVTLEENNRLGPILNVEVSPRSGNKPICSVCKKPSPGYDTLPSRKFEFIPIWGIIVYFVYSMRRVNCPTCGVKVELVPWAEGKNRLTTTYAWFLSRWAKRMSWSDTAKAFKTSWYHVYTAVEMAVKWGRAHLNLNDITAIGVDEIAVFCGHHYVTLVYQINEGVKRLLWIGKDRTEQSLNGFFDWLGEERSLNLKYVCSDMWKAYLKVIAKRAINAINILDRFHIMQHMNKAIDFVRNIESKKMEEKGLEPILKKTRWIFLKKEENLTEKQAETLSNVVKYNLKTVKSYLMKLDFEAFWEYVSPFFAGRFLDQWCTRTMRSKIEPMKKVAKMLRKHRNLLLNWFRAKKQFSSGSVEGLNNKAKAITKRAYGFHTLDCLELALYHNMGDLPEPEVTHRFS